MKRQMLTLGIFKQFFSIFLQSLNKRIAGKDRNFNFKKMNDLLVIHMVLSRKIMFGKILWSDKFFLVDKTELIFLVFN